MSNILNYSDPNEVYRKLQVYYPGTHLYFSTKPNKKYMIQHPVTGRFIHFGDASYADFTKHKDEKRRRAYLQRATAIKGNWKYDDYSPNWLSIRLLW